jgi:hypothetical protein
MKKKEEAQSESEKLHDAFYDIVRGYSQWLPTEGDLKLLAQGDAFAEWLENIEPFDLTGEV